jgi:hypothetical protein
MLRRLEGAAEALASLQAIVESRGLDAFEKGNSSPNCRCTVVKSYCFGSNIAVVDSVLMIGSYTVVPMCVSVSVMLRRLQGEAESADKLMCVMLRISAMEDAVDWVRRPDSNHGLIRSDSCNCFTHSTLPLISSGSGLLALGLRILVLSRHTYSVASAS